MASFFLSILLGVAAVQALPALVPRQGVITALSDAQIGAYDVYAHYAGAAFCDSAIIETWNCGPQCSANSQFNVTAAGGNGGSIQNWFVGYDVTLNTVIVAHQGTDTSKLEPILTDLKIMKSPLDPSLFPGLSDEIEVHTGFRDAQAMTTSSILPAAQHTMSLYGTNSVTLIGHSLGAAIALIDSVYLSLNLPKGTTFRTILYGLPRVGNQAFATYVDSNLHVTHINNKKDPIPVLPPMLLGFVHPSGEVHIRKSNGWANCPGQDNPDKACSTGDVKDILFSHEADHNGPYNNIMLTCSGQ